MDLEYLTERMREYNSAVAHGSECHAWQDYVKDCMDTLECLPWDEPETDASEISSYWIDVANGVSDDYDSEGTRLES